MRYVRDDMQGIKLMVGGMAFGTSWGITRSAIEQIKSSKDVPEPHLAITTKYLLDVSDFR